MRIDSANIGMDSARTYQTTQSTVRRYAVTTYSGTGDFTGLLNTGTNTADENLDADTAGKNEKKSTGGTLSEYVNTMRSRVNDIKSGNISANSLDDPREQLRRLREECINYLLRLFFPERVKGWTGSGAFDSFTALGGGKTMVTTQSTEYYFEESEETSFSTTGTVRTADGREIDFNLNLNMSRRFEEYYSEEIQMASVSLCDPLVINLEGDIPELSDQTFYFDIDCDGVEDEISRLISGSGFLALDENGDGIINNGSELFGTSSGNGFADLAAYDDDGNGFIDEGDEVFDKLKIWAMDEEGQMQLYSLRDKGVGAISLQNMATNFSLNSLEDNSTRGVIKSTGVFLYENGKVGTVQQVDLAKHGGSAISDKLAAYA